MDAETLAAEVREAAGELAPETVGDDGFVYVYTSRADINNRRKRAYAALDSLVALAARVPQLEAERDGYKNVQQIALAERDEAQKQRDFYQRAMIAAEREREPCEARVAQLETAARRLAEWNDRWPDNRLHSATLFMQCHDELTACVDVARTALEQTP